MSCQNSTVATALAWILFAPSIVASCQIGDAHFPVDQSELLHKATDDAAKERLRLSASELEIQLEQVAPGKGWAMYLSCATLRDVPNSNEPLGDTERTQLEALLLRYQSIADDDQYGVISGLPEFQKTISALQKYLKPVDTRRRHNLTLAFDRLNEQLRERENGEKWVTYFALPKELISEEVTLESGKSASRLLKRFRKVNSDSKYAEVTALPTFLPAYEALQLVGGESKTLPPPVSTPEQRVASSIQKPSLVEDQPAVVPEQTPASVQPTIPVGQRILEAVVELDVRLATVEPGSDWPKRLSLNVLRGAVPVYSNEPPTDKDRKPLEEILGTYQAIAKDKENAAINELPEFREALEALEAYLKPDAAQPPKKPQDQVSSKEVERQNRRIS